MEGDEKMDEILAETFTAYQEVVARNWGTVMQ